MEFFNPLHAELTPTCHLLALVGAHHILHVSRIRVKYQCNAENSSTFLIDFIKLFMKFLYMCVCVCVCVYVCMYVCIYI
jgi:hypothetical protein